MTGNRENRESFFARIDFMSPTEQALIRDAYDMAKATHKGQVRKECDANGIPKRYFEHVREAAIIAIDELHVTSAVIVTLIELHDVLEDAEDAADVTPEVIERRFGALITRQLLLLSKKRAKDGASEEERARLRVEYIHRLRHYADLIVLIAKGCDRLHNLRTLCCHGTTIGFIRKQCAETRRDYVPLFAKMEEMARETEYHAAALHLRILIHEQLVRCEVRLEQMERELAAANERTVDDDNAFVGDHAPTAATPAAPAAVDPMAPDGEDDAVCADYAARNDRANEKD